MELRLLPVIGAALLVPAHGCRAVGGHDPPAARPEATGIARGRGRGPAGPAPSDLEAPRAPTTASATDGGLLVAKPQRSVPFSQRAPLQPPPLPVDTTVLHVGDSFAAALGVDLNRELLAAGVRGILRYKTASFIPEWAFSKELPVWLAQYDPDLVIVTLGANELAIEKPERRAPTVRRLVRLLGNRPCVWIAIPLWNGGNGLLDVIRDNVGPCRYMDTNAILPSLPRVGDGVHPTYPARKRWAKVVLEWLARQRQPRAGRPWELRPPEPAPSPTPGP